MARITLEHIRHAYGVRPSAPKDYALREVNHEWADGGAYALLGPSGCGKTTLLNIISGLVRPSEGRILFNSQDVTDLSTEERNIAQVFQFPVVYDTMTVYDNLAFPLRNRRVPEDQVDRRVREILGVLDLSDRAQKRASGLTADLKQKISLGRGLVRSDVNAILFDEPLTVIDPHMKWVLRSQLKTLHRHSKVTMVYVTHDQTEALTFADKVVVMYEGEIVQIGTPAELFETPQAHLRWLLHRLSGHECVSGIRRGRQGPCWRHAHRAWFCAAHSRWSKGRTRHQAGVHERFPAAACRSAFKRWRTLAG